MAGALSLLPAPRRRIGRLQFALTGYLRRHPAGHLFASPADIFMGAGHLLTIEVLSPSSIRADRFTKRRLPVSRISGSLGVVQLSPIFRTIAACRTTLAFLQRHSG